MITSEENNTLKGKMFMGNMVREYELLRNEINQKIDLVNTLTTFTLTTTVAILTFALAKDNALLFLLPFCIIIPMYIRISYYRSALVKLSAYMIVFLETKIDEFNWETRNAHLMNNIIKKGNTIVLRAGYYEGVVISLVCYILYFCKSLKTKNLSVILMLQLFVPFLLVVWMLFIVKHINDIDREKQAWIKEWEKLAEELQESNIN